METNAINSNLKDRIINGAIRYCIASSWLSCHASRGVRVSCDFISKHAGSAEEWLDNQVNSLKLILSHRLGEEEGVNVLAEKHRDRVSSEAQPEEIYKQALGQSIPEGSSVVQVYEITGDHANIDEFLDAMDKCTHEQSTSDMPDQEEDKTVEKELH
jgi:hypothetical protein